MRIKVLSIQVVAQILVDWKTKPFPDFLEYDGRQVSLSFSFGRKSLSRS